MKIIRIGNDIHVRWTIMRYGAPEDFDGNEIKVVLTNQYGSSYTPDVTVSPGGILEFTFYGKDQVWPGLYTLTLQECNGGNEMVTVDRIDAFRLVARQNSVVSEVPDNSCHPALEVSTVDIMTELAVQSVPNNRRPLPFLFTDVYPAGYTGVLYDRERRAFVREVSINNFILDDVKNGYNMVAEDGTITASTKRRFVCYGKIYRFTGIDFLDVALERTATPQYTGKAASIHAHPGLIYKGNILKIVSLGEGQVEKTVSLKNMYLNGSPLVNHQIKLDAQYESASLTIDGDNVTVRGNECDYAYIELSLPDGSNGLAVKYTASGKKIFYYTNYTPHTPAWNIPKSGLSVDDYLYIFKKKNDYGDIRTYVKKLRAGNRNLKIEMYRKYNNVMKNPNNELQRCRIYKWTPVAAVSLSLRQNAYGIRIKRRIGGLWTEWKYFYYKQDNSFLFVSNRHKAENFSGKQIHE